MSREVLEGGRARALELAFGGAPARQSLEVLASALESALPGAAVAILVVDALRPTFELMAGPSLPDTLRDRLAHVDVDEHHSACGSAFYAGQPVTTADIAHDPQWLREDDLRQEVLAHHFQACWSLPIITLGADRFGAIDVFGRDPLDGRQVLDYMETTARTAALILSRAVAAPAADDRTPLLLTLDDQVRPLFEPDEIIATAAGVLGRHLAVNRCAYAEVEGDEDTFTLTGNYTDGAPSIVGQYRFSQFGAQCLRAMRAGESWVVRDTEHDPRIGPMDRPAYRNTAIGAVICVPILKAGRFVAAMAVHTLEPRGWTDHEVDLVQQVASRCWESIERARISRRLRQSESRFRQLADSIANLAWMADATGFVYWYNQQWYTYTGTTPEQMRTQGWGLVHDPVWAPKVKERWAAAIASGEPFEMVYPLRSASGEFRRFLTRANPVYDEHGGVVQWFGTNTDVEGERAAAETNALLRAAVESTNDTVIITDGQLDAPGPRIQYVNDAFVRMTGYTAQEVLGRHPRFLQGPETDRKELARLRRHLEAGEAFVGEACNYRKDGTSYMVEWRISPLKSATGEILNWVSVQRDVSEEHEAERQRAQLLAAEQAARAQAERLGQLKDEFLATLSHELRTPLNAILGWSHLLATGTVGDEQTQKGAAIIARNAKAQAQIVEDLLDMSGIILGKVRLTTALVDVATIVRAALESVQTSADARRIAITVSVARDVPRVIGDAGRLQQVVWNLLTNAVKFTTPGGHIDVALQREGTGVRLQVSDTGRGITADFLPFVFDRFRQADASITRSSGGLGLGLSLVKQLTELHGGHVTAESRGEGLGSTFVVRLPGAPAASDGPIGAAAGL